jgi:hypothetical protein
MTLALATAAVLLLSSAAVAGEASSSANVTHNGFGPGTAIADAAYNGGGRGYANTDARSGNVSLARGTAFGVDRNGITFSTSTAIGGRFLPTAASTLNITIGRDGSYSSSGGFSSALGSRTRSAGAGGFAANPRSGATSGATVTADSGRRGQTIGRTWSRSRPPSRFGRAFRR